MLTTNLASEDWYKNGRDKYNFATGAARSPADQPAANKFTEMLWKSSKTVGFGVKGKWVVAWYCDSRRRQLGNTGPPSSFVKQIGSPCVTPTGGNRCLNEALADQHNELRA